MTITPAAIFSHLSFPFIAIEQCLPPPPPKNRKERVKGRRK